MEEFEGYIERITYRNAENGYTVLSVVNGDDEIMAVGIFPAVSEGEFVKLTGEYTIHHIYGPQLKVSSFEFTEPSDALAIERYLGSGAITGVGVKLAHRIVSFFGDDTLRIMEEEPERLAEIRGISTRMAMDITEQILAKREIRHAVTYLQKFDIPLTLGMRIYKQYGEKMYSILSENPYRMADDIRGIGFLTADEIAKKMHIDPHCEYRTECAMLYVLQQALQDGHTYLTLENLIRKTEALLLEPLSGTEHLLEEMYLDRRIVTKKSGTERWIYLRYAYEAENETAIRMKELNISDETVTDAEIEKCIEDLKKEKDFVPDEDQMSAVRAAMKNGVTILTGGPGTGKTTTVNALIHVFLKEGLTVSLAAPTGRAAKRMTEATGYEAKTIHRLLEVRGGMEDSDVGIFGRNADFPLESDVVIVDEMSMVDIFLMRSLLQAMVPGMRLILVGDADQLPSVGPGQVLRDFIDSDCFFVIHLTKIFRQQTESDIVVNAHKINSGEIVEVKKSNDFLFVLRDEAERIIGATITLIREKLPPYVQAGIGELQVLTPMKKGLLGVENLNRRLQEALNPADSGKNEKQIGDILFREGDKVMQIKNDYGMEWRIEDKRHPMYGTGIYNGDIGTIREINHFEETLTVVFDDEKAVTYPFSQCDELEQAYAITIHKSQGAEYPAVVIPLLSGPEMLLHRRLLYTAVTRAKKCVCIVGNYDLFCRMTVNVSKTERFTGLKDMIKEIYGSY